MTVRQSLKIHATGKVSGKIRYSMLIVEEGGEIGGDVTRQSNVEKSVRPVVPVPAPVKSAFPMPLGMQAGAR